MPKRKQLKYDKAYLRMAHEWGKLSYCERKQVGAIIVKDRMIISDGGSLYPICLCTTIRVSGIFSLICMPSGHSVRLWNACGEEISFCSSIFLQDWALRLFIQE